MAMLLENAGGVATTGTMPILDIKPTDIHQRTPGMRILLSSLFLPFVFLPFSTTSVFLGSPQNIAELKECFVGYENGPATKNEKK
jgi:fructose-1,6-bisphosphatase